MRTRLTKEDRRANILEEAKNLFQTLGYGQTEMEDIRKACNMSRGGLYHHFANKGAILDALAEAEVGGLADKIRGQTDPIASLLQHGSVHLGQEKGLLSAFKSIEEKRDYLSALDQAFAADLLPVLAKELETLVAPELSPEHVAELFITVNSHINRRVMLNEWSDTEASRFAGTALIALTPLLKVPDNVQKLIEALATE